jgi:hypothetical protein
MSKRSSKKIKRRRKALPVLGITGLSVSLASGAAASTNGPAADIASQNISPNHEIFLSEEEISDVSLATFYVFDKENESELGQPLKLARGGGCGCGHGGGCGCGHGGGCAVHGGGFGCGHGCGRGCGCGRGFFRGCGCGGCGGCGCGGCGGGCGICWVWTPLGWCWGESTPPAKVASVVSEQTAQTAEIAVKGDRNTDGRTK